MPIEITPKQKLAKLKDNFIAQVADWKAGQKKRLANYLKEIDQFEIEKIKAKINQA